MFLDKIQVDRMGLQKPSEDANLLWNVTFVPCNNRDYTHTSTLENNDPWNSKKCKLLCNVIKEIPAYLFILDEEDGYRLNWISLYHYRADQTKNKTVGQNVHRKENSVKWNKVENLVVSMNDCDTGWRDCWSDRQTGLKAMLGPDHSTTPSISNEKALHVAFTAFLSMTALLQDILLRYPKFLKHSKTKAYNGCSIDSEQHQRSIPIIPNYTYDVVSVTEGGQMIEVLLVFSAPDQSCWYKKSIQQNEEYKSKSVGVFILIDLITQDYMELSWLKSNYSIDDDLVQICRLALGRRRHSLTSTGTTNSIQHDIAAPLELLYPDCQAIDNIAVRQQRPVLSIKARSSPIELYYG